MGGWTGEGKDTIIWDGTIRAKKFQGNGEELIGVWLNSIAQTGLTGNKTGSFDLTTTGKIRVRADGSSSSSYISAGSTDKFKLWDDGVTSHIEFDDGDLNILSKNTGLGENIVLTAGVGTLGISGGDIDLTAGAQPSNAGSGTGGNVDITAGAGSNGITGDNGTNGGNVDIIAGAGGNGDDFGGDGGNITINAGAFGPSPDTNGATGVIKLGNTQGDIQAYQDTYFINSGSGLPYGSCYGNEIAWSQASAVQNTWYNVSDADMTDGQLNLVTHDGSGKLTISKAGRYLINYSASVSCSANNHHVEGGIEVSGSGSADANGNCSWYPQTANAEGILNSTLILSLAANATIEFCIRTATAGTPTLSVNHLNITIVQIGG